MFFKNDGGRFLVNDIRYMKLALTLAKSVLGQTSPNPPVGSVVVNNGNIVGFGAHLKAGAGHAEVYALEMAGEMAKGGTIYVTLEPCSHYGKTPPCADLIIKSGVRRAVISVLDSNPLVAGKGIEKLEQAGIEVVVGVLEKEGKQVNEIFFHYARTKEPYITMKYAVSMDGKTATYTGDSKWITGELARADVHEYRDLYDAILVGVNTVIVDDPSLTARLPHGGGRNPLRIILDTRLRTPIGAKLVNDGLVDTWIFVGNGVTEEEKAVFLTKNKVKVIQLESSEVDVTEVLTILGEAGIMSLYVEGGATVHAAFLEANRINQLITYIAPKLIGGKDAPSAITGAGFANMVDVMKLDVKKLEMLGPDIKITSVSKEEV